MSTPRLSVGGTNGGVYYADQGDLLVKAIITLEKKPRKKPKTDAVIACFSIIEYECGIYRIVAGHDETKTWPRLCYGGGCHHQNLIRRRNSAHHLIQL